MVLSDSFSKILSHLGGGEREEGVWWSKFKGGKRAKKRELEGNVRKIRAPPR